MAPLPTDPQPSAGHIAADLNELLLPFHACRLERLGVDHSGLFNFYRQLLERGEIIGDREARIAALVVERLQGFDCYDVLRAGLGELALSLAALGFSTVAHDPDRYRVEAIAASIAYLKREQGWPENRISVHLGAIPKPAPGKRTLCVAIHALFGFDPDDDATVPDRFASYDAVLFEPRTLCRMREERSERDRLVAAFRAGAFPDIEAFPALGLVCARKRPTL